LVVSMAQVRIALICTQDHILVLGMWRNRRWSIFRALIWLTIQQCKWIRT
jgi:hypothetical protein